ncbi:MarR family winged helix-turn-helix transcriptional regulator [Streptomyces sp. NPDC020883]|uniref:MarR family winged helix-turn-helix transcriptional regulator n=1 Tax=Streptomyces sp. NPDC020883 TaxID=3365099 RepID=UPI0037A141BE
MTPRPDPLTVEVVDLIGTVVARYHEEYERAAAEHSLTGAQARLLRMLVMEPMPMRKLAQCLKCEPSNVTGIVDRLESRGLVERRPDPADRRVKLAVPTPEGRETAERLRTSLDFARQPLGRLTVAERTLLRELLQRMLGVEQEADEDAGDTGGTGSAGTTGRGKKGGTAG